jgi:hypothetical protein
MMLRGRDFTESAPDPLSMSLITRHPSGYVAEFRSSRCLAAGEDDTHLDYEKARDKCGPLSGLR